MCDSIGNMDMTELTSNGKSRFAQAKDKRRYIIGVQDHPLLNGNNRRVVEGYFMNGKSRFGPHLGIPNLTRFLTACGKAIRKDLWMELENQAAQWILEIEEIEEEQDWVRQEKKNRMAEERRRIHKQRRESQSLLQRP